MAAAAAAACADHTGPASAHVALSMINVSRAVRAAIVVLINRQNLAIAILLIAMRGLLLALCVVAARGACEVSNVR